MDNEQEGVALGSKADRSNTQGVPSSDKLDSKLNDKLSPTDCELALIVKAWSKLPEAIRSAILSIVRQATEGNTLETDQSPDTIGHCGSLRPWQPSCRGEAATPE